MGSSEMGKASMLPQGCCIKALGFLRFLPQSRTPLRLLGSCHPWIAFEPLQVWTPGTNTLGKPSLHPLPGLIGRLPEGPTHNT